MIQYFLERPYLIAIMVAVILLTLFVCVKAGQASAKRSKANEEIIKKLKEENALRNEFAVLTEKLAMCDKREYNVAVYRLINAEDSPFIIAIQKNKLKKI